MARAMTTERSRDRRRGSAIVEFAMVFIPFIALMLGVFELGRAMWTFHSLSAAVKRAARYMAVRGSSCSAESESCSSSVADVAEIIRKASLGLEPGRFRVTLAAGSQTIDCASLTSCLSDPTYWPATPNNSVGRQITIIGEYAFHTFVFSFWPGPNERTITFHSESSEVIQF